MKNKKRHGGKRRAIGAIALTLRDLFNAVRSTNSWLLVPLIIVLLALSLVAALIALTGPIAPFLYPVI